MILTRTSEIRINLLARNTFETTFKTFETFDLVGKNVEHRSATSFGPIIVHSFVLLLSRDEATLHEGLSVGPSAGWSVSRMVGNQLFFCLLGATYATYALVLALVVVVIDVVVVFVESLLVISF